MTRKTLFPEITPYDTGMLALDDIHTMYWQQCGNPKGVPVIFFHGGPGGGASPKAARFFDPKFYRIIVYDQRGAGRSTPFGEIRENTTQHLIRDIETLRHHLKIDQWLLFGGSWGSTLGLAYGQAHPERVLGYVMRGIFLGRDSEIDWFLYGCRKVFPEAWQKFVDHIPEEERGDLLTAYYKRVQDPNPSIHLPAAKVYSRFEGEIATFMPNEELVREITEDHVAISLARLEAHYFKNRLFLDENELLDNMDRINHLPSFIVQGRYDMICPPFSAYDLAQKWPKATLTMVPMAGHSSSDQGILENLIKATEEFKKLLG